MSRRARLGALAALLVGALALAFAPGGASAVSFATAGAHGKAPAKHGRRRAKCARRTRRRRHQSRRCQAKPHEKTSAPIAPAAATVIPAVVLAPGVQALAPSLAAPPAPIAISSAPATEGAPAEAAPEAGEPEPPSIPHVQVSAVEYSFSLSRTTVPAGEVVLEFVNDGQDEHNLHLEGGEGPLSESIGNTPSKGVSDLHLEMRPGSYTLFCSLPTHEARGMKATLTVE